jgi:hypothetical protein
MNINKLLLFISICCFTTVIFSQPLNNSFESWEITGMPTDWFTTGPPSVNQVSVSYEGSSAAHLEVIDVGGFSFIPVMQSLDATFNGHPVSEKHGSLQGWYQLMPLGSDFLLITVAMLSGNTGVGAGAIAIPTPTSGWTQFTCPIFYTPGSPTPDNTIISIVIADTATGGKFGTIGSMGYVDYLTFTGPSAVEQINGLPQDYNLSQNYPNPFNPTTNIEYSIPEQSFVQLKVYDVLGNEVASLVNQEQNAGVYRADFSGKGLASGLYIAQLTAGNYVQTIKMSLLK